MSDVEGKRLNPCRRFIISRATDCVHLMRPNTFVSKAVLIKLRSAYWVNQDTGKEIPQLMVRPFPFPHCLPTHQLGRLPPQPRYLRLVEWGGGNIPMRPACCEITSKLGRYIETSFDSFLN